MMATYATQTDFTNYSEGVTVTDSDKLERYLERAQRDVDDQLGTQPGARDATTGLRIAPASLPAWKRDRLRDAVCAQAEYLITMGDEFLIRDQHESTGGPQFSASGRLSRMGPKVFEELRGTGLLNAWGGTGGHGPVNVFGERV